MIYRVLMHRLLEAVQDRVDADAFTDGEEGFTLEPGQQPLLIVVVMRVDYLVGESYKSIDRVDWSSQFLTETTYSN